MKIRNFLISLLLPTSNMMLGFEGKVLLEDFSENSCLIIKEMHSNKILHQEGDVFFRESPCSTFKIALSLMGYDSGILQNTTSPEWPYDENYQSKMDIHKTSHNPLLWMQHSCVWFSQQLTRQLGTEKFANYTHLFQYGNEDISGDLGKNNGLSQCWLSSSLKISPLEQILFLEKFLKKKLPVSSSAQEITQQILYVQELSNGWKLYGKTGTGFRDFELHIGWFVGWATKQEKTLLIVLLTKDHKKESLPAGLRAREKIKQLLHSKDLLP